MLELSLSRVELAFLVADIYDELLNVFLMDMIHLWLLCSQCSSSWLRRNRATFSRSHWRPMKIWSVLLNMKVKQLVSQPSIITVLIWHIQCGSRGLCGSNPVQIRTQNLLSLL